MDYLKPFADNLMSFCQKRLGFKRPPRLFYKEDEKNASNILGFTGQYNPGKMEITVFTTGRHPKDILRSIAHELVHHHQNIRGDLNKLGISTDPGYAQKDPHMRKMEKQAYLIGNLLLRDWEDGIKHKHNKEVNIMITEEKYRQQLRKKIRRTIHNLLNESDHEPIPVYEEEEENEASTDQVRVNTPEQEDEIQSSIFAPRLVALNARLMSNWSIGK